MSDSIPYDRLVHIKNEVPNIEIDAQWVSDLFEIIEEIIAFYIYLPQFLEQATEECAQIFSILLARLPDVHEASTREQIYEIFEKSVHRLTLVENKLYREDEPNDALRSMLFQLTEDAGLTPVPHQTGKLSVLDYRYNPEFGHYEKKSGEIMEGKQALDSFEENMSDQTALEALVELGDAFYNMLKLSQDESLGLNLKDILEGVLTDCDPDRKNQLSELYFDMCNIAIWKFWFRYLQSNGKKNPDREMAELAKRWGGGSHQVSPEEFLVERINDCQQLLIGVAKFSEDIIERKMTLLKFTKAQREKVREHMIHVEELVA